MEAPAGFIIQLTFLDFYLEEAPGCIYDHVVVHNSSTNARFCGPTANGLTLNSTGNVMELLFTSDFSVQKKGFAVSYQRGRCGLRPVLLRFLIVHQWLSSSCTATSGSRPLRPSSCPSS